MTPRRPAAPGRTATRLVAALLACVLAAALAACGSTRSAAQPDQTRPPAPSHAVAGTPTRTTVTVFTGYDADGRPTAPSTATANGYCWNTSLAASGPRAFRCFSDADGGSRIYDPCFAPPTAHPTSVECVNDPWSPATTLRLTQPLPAASGNEVVRPWAVELANGTRCVASTGTVPTVAGTNLPYHCSDGTAAALGTTSAAVVAAVDANPDAPTLTRTTVLALWRTS